MAAARLGGRVGDISHAVETHVRAQGRYGILEDYTGHGIGTEMHMPPNVPNFGRRGRGPAIVEGLALAVEPMVTLGSQEHRPARGRVDRRDRRRVLRRALRAHLHGDPAGRVGAHGRRRRRGPPRRPRRPIRRTLTSISRPPRDACQTDAVGGEYSLTVVSSVRRPRERRPVPLVRRAVRAEETSGVRALRGHRSRLIPRSISVDVPTWVWIATFVVTIADLHLRPRSSSAAGRTSRA